VFRMIGSAVSHYQIFEKPGEGGMGVVYKARDTHLGRLVAIKVLPPAKVTDPERKRRFIQEARAASALNHPHIVTIYDIDTADNVTFIAMIRTWQDPGLRRCSCRNRRGGSLVGCHPEPVGIASPPVDTWSVPERCSAPFRPDRNRDGRLRRKHSTSCSKNKGRRSSRWSERRPKSKHRQTRWGLTGSLHIKRSTSARPGRCEVRARWSQVRNCRC
jgi:hypothetical protein